MKLYKLETKNKKKASYTLDQTKENLAIFPCCFFKERGRNDSLYDELWEVRVATLL